MLANDKNAEDSFKELFRQIQALFVGASIDLSLSHEVGKLAVSIKFGQQALNTFKNKCSNEEIKSFFLDLQHPGVRLNDYFKSIRESTSEREKLIDDFNKKKFVPQIYKDALFDISLNFELIEELKNIVPKHTFIGSFKSILDNVPIKLESDGIHTTFNLIKNANIYHKLLITAATNDEKGSQVIEAVVDTISQLKLLSPSEKLAIYQQIIQSKANKETKLIAFYKIVSEGYARQINQADVRIIEGLSWQLKFAFNPNKLKLLIAVLVNLIGCSLIISLGSLGLAAAMTTVGFFGFNLLIQLIGYGFDELLPNNKIVQNLLSPLLQIGLTVGLVFATLALFPAIGPSIWILMTPIEISYAIKITMQITSSYKNLDVSTPSTSWRKKLTVSLPLMITAIGTGLILIFSPKLFQPLTLHYGLALIGCYIAIQVIIYSLDIIKQSAARAITQFLVNIGLSAALIGILLPLMPVTSSALQIIMISTLAASCLIRLFLNVIQDNSTNQPEVSSILNTEKPDQGQSKEKNQPSHESLNKTRVSHFANLQL
jgi:hypothetical protein